jgi:beta-glucosidase
MKMKKWLLVLMTVFAIGAKAQDAKSDSYRMKAYIDGLMKKMTLDEKLGQLNLPGSGDIVTGQASNSDIGKKIKEGKVGGLFNIKSVEKIKAVQKVAVEESRLKIPLIFGMDVIHGYETVFPIPPHRKQVQMVFAGHFLQWLILPVIHVGAALLKEMGKILISALKLQWQW